LPFSSDLLVQAWRLRRHSQIHLSPAFAEATAGIHIPPKREEKELIGAAKVGKDVGFQMDDSRFFVNRKLYFLNN
jgi:hypothetical protein